MVILYGNDSDLHCHQPQHCRNISDLEDYQGNSISNNERPGHAQHDSIPKEAKVSDNAPSHLCNALRVFRCNALQSTK